MKTHGRTVPGLCEKWGGRSASCWARISLAIGSNHIADTCYTAIVLDVDGTIAIYPNVWTDVSTPNPSMPTGDYNLFPPEET